MEVRRRLVGNRICDRRRLYRVLILIGNFQDTRFRGNLRLYVLRQRDRIGVEVESMDDAL